MKQILLPDTKTQLRLAWIVLILIMLCYAVDMSYQTVLRYDTFKATAFDLGNMDQVVWNTLHGRLFQFTNQGIDWYGPPTRLGVHFEPILIPLSLLYVFHADPRILLVFQTLVLVTGALPVFLLTRKHIEECPLLAPVMAAAYLLSPSLLGLNLFDFHPVSLATPLLLYAVLALERKRYGWFLVACLFAAACKEEIPLVVAGLGILVIWKYKLPRLGIPLILGGFVWSMLAFLVIMPHFAGVQHNNFWYRYETLGSSPGVAILNLFIRPWLFFSTFFTLNRLYYLINLSRSTGFFAWLAPEWLIPALPSLAINLLSVDPLLNNGIYHYNAAIIPFIMVAAIHGMRRFILCWRAWREEPEEKQYPGRPQGSPPSISTTPAPTGMTVQLVQATTQQLGMLFATIQHSTAVTRSVAFIQPGLVSFSQARNTYGQRFSLRMKPLAASIPLPRLQEIACGWIVVMSILNFAIMNPVLNVLWADHVPGQREQHIQQLLAMIPANASVSASDNLNPHLTDRLYVTVFPEIKFSTSKQSLNNTVQYVIVDLNALFPEDRVTATYTLNQLQNSGQFRSLGRAEGVVLLVKRSL